MKKLFKQLSIFAVVSGLVAFVGFDAMAVTNANVSNTSTAGTSLLNDFAGNLKGTVGTTLGLLISLFGLYMWIWNQVSWGIIVAVAGALLTAFPGIYDNLRGGAEKAFSNTKGKTTSTD